MEPGYILGTKRSREEVTRIAESAGFDSKNLNDFCCSRRHKEVRSLWIQINSPAYLESISGIETEIEFSNNWGDSIDEPGAIRVLGQLYEKMPELVYEKKMMQIEFGLGRVSEILNDHRAYI